MYKVLLAVKSGSVLRELKKLRIWGDSTGFQICGITSDFENLLTDLKEAKYHLVLLEALPDDSVFALLRTIKQEKLCEAAAMVCQDVDFKTVRKSFLSGADDYFVTPFEVSQFIALFSKIENADHGKIAAEICRTEEIIYYFDHVDLSVKDYLDKLLYASISEHMDMAEAFACLKRTLDGAVTALFERYEWLRFYFRKEDYLLREEGSADYEERISESIEEFYAFFLEFSELYPAHGESLEGILLYILNRPEDDLRQKTISEELYINRSYLSTVFAAQIGINFVDYVNTVKLKRAAYLLKHTKMKVIDIAGTLNYKDMGYFLKKFKAKYGVTPSQYRIPETYEFQI